LVFEVGSGSCQILIIELIRENLGVKK